MAPSTSRLLPLALLLPLLACGAEAQQPQEQAQIPELTELNWPRKYERDGNTVVVYDPQIDSWEDHELLKARSAIVVTAAGEKADAFGILEYEVKTETQPEGSFTSVRYRLASR